MNFVYLTFYKNNNVFGKLHILSVVEFPTPVRYIHRYSFPSYTLTFETHIKMF